MLGLVLDPKSWELMVEHSRQDPNFYEPAENMNIKQIRSYKYRCPEE